MIRKVISILFIAAIVSFGAQGSGIYFEGHFSQGKMKGDTLAQFGNGSIGYKTMDTYSFGMVPIEWIPVEFQYAVRYGFGVGYEKSFNKVLSLRGAVGYQLALLDVDATFSQNYGEEVLYCKAEISRHWITIPIDFKLTLPVRKSGFYVALGPKASLLVASEYKNYITDLTIGLTDQTPRFNLGLGFRVGTELAIGRIGYLLIEGGYTCGLINMAFDNLKVLDSSKKIREGEIVLLSLGFRINLPKTIN